MLSYKLPRFIQVMESNIIPYLRATAITANGIYAGLALTVTFVGTPMLRATGYPIAGWASLYGRGAKMAVSSVVVATSAYLSLFYYTSEKRFLVSGILAFFSAPWTILVMVPTNRRLQAINAARANPNTNQTKAGDSDMQRDEVKPLIEKWDKLNTVRTVTGTVSFLLTVWQWW
ncbi:hypothetical protein BX666DRAFT_135397 [Dichotomocladium elegans]|nr:hypothetical protein BX666DRAFT_135397 [Dichotomocladium elegans]